MSFILNIADYFYNSICIFTNNVYNYFYPIHVNINVNNNTNNTLIPPAISEEEVNLSDNSDDENDNRSINNINQVIYY